MASTWVRTTMRRRRFEQRPACSLPETYRTRQQLAAIVPDAGRCPRQQLTNWGPEVRYGEHTPIADGDIVRIWNDRGQLLAGAIVSDELMPGVAQLATGAWYDPVEPFGLDRRGNANVLSLDKGASSLSQAPSAQTCLVEIERWQDAVPPLGPDAPPEREQAAA